IGVDEPARDTIGSITDHLAGLWLEDIHAVQLHAQLAVLLVQEGDVRLAEDDEQVTLAGVLEVFGHVEVGVHTRLENRDAAQRVELGGVRLVVERARDQDIEPRIARFAGSSHEIRALHGAEFWADEDGGAYFGLALQVAALGTDQLTGPRGEGREGNPV